MVTTISVRPVGRAGPRAEKRKKEPDIPTKTNLRIWKMNGCSRTLAEMSARRLSERSSPAATLLVETVEDWHVFPAMRALDPCCAEAQWRGAMFADDFRLWIDFTAVQVIFFFV